MPSLATTIATFPSSAPDQHHHPATTVLQVLSQGA
jgi:hypothetical protein